jgi:Glycosyltransferase sugar-binding region containing DXD motif
MLRHRGTGRSSTPYSHFADRDDDAVRSTLRKRRRGDRSWSRCGTTAPQWHLEKLSFRWKYVWAWLSGAGIIAWCLFLYLEEPLGTQVDAFLRQRYYLHLLRQQQQQYNYPDVIIKATRKLEHNHYSYYLYELFRHRAPPSSALAATTTHGAARETPSRLARTTKHCSTLVRWFCQRCLRSGFQGSYDRCPSRCCVCSDTSPVEGEAIVPSLLHLSDPRRILRLLRTNDASSNNHTMIPRTIHQVGPALIRTLEYPELARFQATWRSLPGLEHYFYTAQDQVAFLTEAYDPVVLQMYQSMALQREEQEHFFALLVLYRYGGIYADTNVQWQLPLDALTQKDDTNRMSPPSLILPRHPHLLQRHCLYNGWVAAAPGHPVLAQLILKSLLRFNGTFAPPNSAEEPIWKWHVAEPEAYRYGGACAWGAAVNAVLRRDVTEDFDRLGHYYIPKEKRNDTAAVEIERDDDWGPILVLMVRNAVLCDFSASRSTLLSHTVCWLSWHPLTDE